MELRPLVLYHADCVDGFGAAFAAWLKFGDAADYVPVGYGEDVFAEHKVDGRNVYVLDFSFDKSRMQWIHEHASTLVWLDHHLSAFKMWLGDMPAHGQYVLGTGPTIWLDNAKSGARLAWEYFHGSAELPKLFQHINDYDLWKFEVYGTEGFIEVLNSYRPWSFEQWRMNFLSPTIGSRSSIQDSQNYMRILTQGEALIRARNTQVDDVCRRATTCTITIVRDSCAYYHSGLAVNCSAHLANHVGSRLAKMSGTFGLCWYQRQDGTVKCSLRSTKSYDVTRIAEEFGGGGHASSSGMKVSMQQLQNWLRHATPYALAL